MNHSTNSNDQQRHYEELFRLFAECTPHLVALGYEPLNLEYEAEPAAGSKEADSSKGNAVQATLSSLSPGDYCVLSSDDFNSLVDDLAEMAESIDWLCRFFQEKEHLAKTLIGIAARLDTSKEENATVKRIMQSMDETMERWEDIELTPISLK